jgi:hypothetical protein
MFDLIFYSIVNKIRTLVDSVNDYSKWTDRIITKEEYKGIYENFINDNKIDIHTYTNLRGYIILADVYFKDYETNYIDKKLRYIKKNLWTTSNNEVLVRC